MVLGFTNFEESDM